ncbi:MAG TPA: hypothetical protein VF219_14740 [Vicinamibacterales bacterium]
MLARLFTPTLVCLSAVAAFAQPPRIRPVLLTGNVPDVAECTDILTQQILDNVNAAGVDPGQSFEQWRRDHRNMMEASPVVDCESKLWNALHRSKLSVFNIASIPADADHFTLKPSDLAMQQMVHAFAASVGSNLDPAGGVSTYQGEVQLAVNPNNPLQIVAGANTFYRDPDPNCQSPLGGSANTFGTQALYGSTDGGVTWTYKCAPWPASLNGGVPGATEYYGSDPAVAWDTLGNAYAVYMLVSQANNGDSGTAIVISRSANSGTTWTSLGTIVDNISNPFAFDDKELVDIDQSPGPPSALSHPGRIYVVWDENNVERIAHSDNGTSWTTVVLPTPGIGQFDIAGNVKVGADGTVYVIWNRLVYTGNKQSSEVIVFSKSVDGGNSWSAPVTVSTLALLSFGNNSLPPAQEQRGVNSFGSLTLDTNSASAYFGRLYVAFSDFPSGKTSGTDTNTYVASSSNGGSSWSPRVKVNDDSGTATQFFPWAAVDESDGTLNVAWYDTRADVNNKQAQFYYARSSNGGASFEPNILVNDNGGTVWNNAVNYSDENNTDNPNSDANQYGDYSGIIAVNRKVYPLWTDSRQFYPLFPGGDDRREDMATAIIVNCSAPSSPAAPAVSIGSSCSTPAVVVTWSAPGGWGTNATGGTYSVYRSTTSTFPGGSPLASGLTSPNYSDTTGSGHTTYYYFVTATNNCPGTALTPMTAAPSAASASIVFPVVVAPPTASVSGDATICAGNSTTISATLTGTGPWNLNWSDGVIQNGVAASPATRLVSPGATTVYTVTAVSDANCSRSGSGSATVTVTPTISAGGPTTFCSPGSVTLTSNSATGNQWNLNGNPINGATGTIYNATATGSYTVTVTSSCSATSAATVVTVNSPPPTPTITPSGSGCNGGTIGLASSAPSGNQWLLNGNPVNGATGTTYSATTTGSYSVQVTVNGCSATSSSIQLNFSPAITVNPPAIPSGVMNAFYTTSFTTTGGSGAMTFSVTGTLPSGLTLSGNTLSGTPTQAGASFPIIITATDANACSSSRAYSLVIALPAGSTPAALVATATSTQSVSLIWTPVAQTNHYEITRGSGGGAPGTIASPVSNSYTDSASLSPSTTYVYRVRAISNSSVASPYSTPDIATTILFTDDPLVANTTAVKGAHILELRTAVNAVRAAGGLGAFTFTDASLSGIPIKATHILELRSALDAGRSAIGVPSMTYANTLTPGTTPVHAVDLTEIRNGVK